MKDKILKLDQMIEIAERSHESYTKNARKSLEIMLDTLDEGYQVTMDCNLGDIIEYNCSMDRIRYLKTIKRALEDTREME